MEFTFLVGSYTESYAAFRAAGDGLTLMRLDAATGRLERLDTLDGLPNPSYVRWHGPGAAHVVMETTDDRAGIALVTRDRGDRLRLSDRVALAGAAPCHLDVHPDRTRLAVACYGSGHIFALGLGADGRPQPPRLLHRHAGASLHPVRQTVAHPHAACFAPGGRHLLVPDLGTDEIWCHDLEAPSAPPRRIAMPPGSGPRLCLFDRDARHLIVVHELGCRVSSWRWDPPNLRCIDDHSTLPPGHATANTAAGLRWHPSGRLLAVSNRGADSIALFAFDAESGRLAPLGHAASGGAKPRDFEFSPCGRWLIAANQDGDGLVVLEVDAAAGTLHATGERCAIGSPSCVRFAPLQAEP